MSQNDCVDAILICGDANLSGLTAEGIGIQEITPDNACSSGENNSLWLKIKINTGGTLGFVLTPQSADLIEDLDFWIFGPNISCGNLGTAIRCSTTNPLASNQVDNLTGMNSTETDVSEGPGFDGNSYVKWMDVLDNEIYYIAIDRPAGVSAFSIAWTGTATFYQTPVPVATTDLRKCSLPGLPGNAIFDLTNNINLAIGSQANVSAISFTSYNDAVTNSNPILDSNAYQNISNPQQIFIRLTNEITSCFAITTFNLNVTLPTVTSFSFITPVCINDINPTAITSSEFTIGGIYSSTTGLSINSSTGNIDLTTSIPGTYTVTYTVLANPAICQSASSSTFIITINPLPSIVSTSTSQLYCVNAAISPITFNVGGLASGVSITNGTLPLGLTGSYSNSVFSINGTPSESGTYNYTLTTIGGCSPPATINGTITVSPTSVAGTISGATTVCSGTNSTLLTLSGSIGTIQWQSSTDNVTFTAISNAAAASYTATNLTTTSFYRALVTSGTCPPATTSATITVSPTTVAGTISGATTVCSGTNSTVLTLLGNIGTIQWQSSTDTITFTDIINATAATYTGTNLTATAFYKAVVTSGACPPETASATITVSPISVAGTISGAATVCSGSNGTLLTLSGSIGTIQWQSSTDNVNFIAISNATAASYIATNLTTTSFYIAVVTTGSCTPATTSATIIVSPASVAGTISGAATVCSGTNSTVLTLSGNIGTIQWQLSTNNVTFTNITNATSATYTGANLTATAFYKAVVTSGACPPATTSSTITVNALPIVTLPQDGFICVDDNGNPIGTYVLTTNLSTATNSFLWSNSNGIIAGQSGSSYTAIAPGTYSVTTTNNSTGCTSFPATASIATFLPPLQVTASVPSYFSDIQSVTITVLPVGDYEYKLDYNSFQESNEFTNLSMGTHEIWVRDKFGCGIKKIVVQIINYPNYFTPNGDSFHDTWNIIELKNQPNSYINIFDRYGKLIKQIKPSGSGWDGNYNGNPLPATDYWFTVYYVEQNKNEQLSSHFSLLR